MTQTHYFPANTRGVANYGWLQAKYSFSFAHFFDRNRMNFGALRVLNDDIIDGGMGFSQHGHDNMEIVSIPLNGALKHRDTMGHEEVINAGEVQVMSAGSGIEHSEMNASSTDPVNLLQLLVIPETQDVEPRYDQKDFAQALQQKNNWITLVSPKDKTVHGSLWVNQQAYFLRGTFEKGQEIQYQISNPNQGAYLFVIEGEATFENQSLKEKDAMGIYNTNTIVGTAQQDVHILLVEVPMTL